MKNHINIVFAGSALASAAGTQSSYLPQRGFSEVLSEPSFSRRPLRSLRLLVHHDNKTSIEADSKIF